MVAQSLEGYHQQKMEHQQEVPPSPKKLYRSQLKHNWEVDANLQKPSMVYVALMQVWLPFHCALFLLHSKEAAEGEAALENYEIRSLRTARA